MATTIGQWLEGLAKSNSSSDEDSARMENFLRRYGFSRARVVLGVVYPEGKGAPISIHSMAQMCLDAHAKAQAKAQAQAQAQHG